VTGDPELVEAIKADYTSAPISEADRVMLDYVAKLTREPWTVEATDVERLRASGFDDRAILDICQVVGYYAFVNRLADGLGVELEEWWKHTGASGPEF
jgi:uncharacterized peroxidase-related enzyme